MERVMVGVDASKTSVDALQRAADEARWRGAVLEIVYIFDPPEQVTAFPVPPSKGRDVARDIEVVRAQATEQLEAWVKETGVDVGDLEVEWSILADRRPSRAIIERSGDADLVVVGARGRGGFAGLKLGSVSEQVIRHAKSPVLVVRESTQ
ncbi:universal stress protein [Nitriliruptor alkaliphilus]|uniref:universal stress protein n=1 Tax=Nitriliruptor alkaliphilus TaxID=427918 RepID=UPI0006977F15|nr:universal stress protein [Nitriliruptor alkaliphilus]